MKRNCRIAGRSGLIYPGLILALGHFCAAGYASYSAQTGLAGAAAFLFQHSDGIEHREAGSKNSRAQVRKEIPYGEEKLVLVSDYQERVGENLYRATGNVTVTFRDMAVFCNEAEFDEKSLLMKTHGKTRFRQDKVSLESSGAEFDFDTQSIIFHDASGYFYDTIGRTDREFFLTGGMVQKIKADKLLIYWDTMKIVIP